VNELIGLGFWSPGSDAGSFGLLAGLFLASLAAATVLPLQSEFVLVGLLLSDEFSWWLPLTVASVGNTLGSVVNWYLGRFVARFQGRRWFPVGREKLARAEAWYRRWGRWSLLLSWAPFVGDPLTVAAGAMRESLPVFVALVALAKTARYVVLTVFTVG
jgi:membrane protein YqaA with SNARE-associated domain